MTNQSKYNINKLKIFMKMRDNMNEKHWKPNRFV